MGDWMKCITCNGSGNMGSLRNVKVCSECKGNKQMKYGLKSHRNKQRPKKEISKMTDLECIKFWLKKDAEFVERQMAKGEENMASYLRGRKYQIQSVMEVIEDIEENK